MIGDVMRNLARDLDDKVDEVKLGDPFLSSHNYRAYPLNVDCFKTIKMMKIARKLAFVDGGNQMLIGAPNFSVQLNRIYFNVFEGRNRIRPRALPQRIEFFSFTFSSFRSGQIFYETSLFPVSNEFLDFVPDSIDLSFSSTDHRIMIGESRADIHRVASIARRFAEWVYAKNVVLRELDERDVLVMDGTLRTAFANESKYAKAAYAVAKDRGVFYTGLSKASRLFTTTGLSLLGAMRKLALDNNVGPIWYYYPIAESMSPEHEAAIFIAKLNDQSQRIFRFEIHAAQAKSMSQEDLNEIFSQLCANASDLTFPGYPYGLIDADDNARVKYEELETYRVMLLSEISKLGSASKFTRHIESMDAHNVLNLMREVSYQ